MLFRSIVRLQPFFKGLARRQFESVLERPMERERVEEMMWKGVVRDVFTNEEKNEDRRA